MSFIIIEKSKKYKNKSFFQIKFNSIILFTQYLQIKYFILLYLLKLITIQYLYQLQYNKIITDKTKLFPKSYSVQMNNRKFYTNTQSSNNQQQQNRQRNRQRFSNVSGNINNNINNGLIRNFNKKIQNMDRNEDRSKSKQQVTKNIRMSQQIEDKLLNKQTKKQQQSKQTQPQNYNNNPKISILINQTKSEPQNNYNSQIEHIRYQTPTPPKIEHNISNLSPIPYSQKNTNSYNNNNININNMNNMNSTNNVNNTIKTNKIEQKCIICSTPTQKCCSLCRKVFYCSSQHQQVDWHTKHKYTCQGKLSMNNNINNNMENSNINKMKFYSNNSNNSLPQSLPNQYSIHNNNVNSQQYQREETYRKIQKFLQLLQTRLQFRIKILSQIEKLNQRTPLIVYQSIIRQTQQLYKLSTKITKQEYKTSYSTSAYTMPSNVYSSNNINISNYSTQNWGNEINISQIGVGLQYISDMVLMGKVYHIGGMSKQARQIIIGLSKMLEQPQYIRLFLQNSNTNQNININTNQNKTNININPQIYSSTNTNNSVPLSHQSIYQPTDSLSKPKQLILYSIIQLSSLYNIDKCTQSAYKLYIKRIQFTQGIWQQIYSYYNIGVWYINKTYYNKSIKTFIYILELLNSHKKNISQSIIFKADCIFNIAIAYWMQNQYNLAIQNMQQCYKLRINAIGKNSIQCTYCLFKLAKWYKVLEKWNQCLQYLDQCYRIRKLYENQSKHGTGYQQQIQQIKKLIIQVYQTIKKQKNKSINTMEYKTQKYYQQLLNKQNKQEQRIENKKYQQLQLLPKDSVSSRLFRDDKQYVIFKVIISQNMWQTINSEQARYLAELIQKSDEKVQKNQAISMLRESKFVGALNAEQRDLFFKENQIGNMPAA